MIFKLIYYSGKKSPNLRLNGDLLYGKPNKQKSKNNMTLELSQQSISSERNISVWRWSRLARENTVYLDDELSLPSVRILLRHRQHFHKGQVSSPGGDLLSPGPSSTIKNPLAWKIKIHSNGGVDDLESYFGIKVWIWIFFSVITFHRMYSFFKYLCSS